MSHSLASLLAECRSRLAEAGLPDAAGDARVLVAGLLDLTLTDLVLGPDRAATEDERRTVDEAIARRLSREPVHRILGRRDFHGVTLLLSPDTLEPRPDTEMLVEAVLPFLRQRAVRGQPVRLLDLGTGTGAIALALLKEVPQLTAVGVDIAPGALETARRNADLNGVAERFSTCESRWFSEVVGRFDIIVSNPPYIRTEVIEALEPDVRNHDPMLALDGGSDGLDAYRAIADGAVVHLADGAMLAVEIGYDQKQAVGTVFSAAGYTLENCVRDYGGNDRVMLFSRKKA